MATFVEQLRAGTTIEALQAHLDGLDGATRLAEVRALRPSDQSKLYDLAQGRHTDLAFYVPDDVPQGVEVIHEGINTLPVIGGPFQKRFARDPSDPQRLLGYNHNHSGVVSHLFWFTGPGYFVVRPRGSATPDGRVDSDGQVFVNYYERPEQAPIASWPAPQPPLRLTASLVWGNMADYMWRVSRHVSIGAAYKNGKKMGQFFALIRQESP